MLKSTSHSVIPFSDKRFSHRLVMSVIFASWRYIVISTELISTPKNYINMPGSSSVGILSNQSVAGETLKCLNSLRLRLLLESSRHKFSIKY